MGTNRETQKSRFHSYVNNYVELTCAQMVERSLPPAHEDFIDGLTREVGFGLEEMLFDEDRFPWPEDSAMIINLRDAEIGCLIAVVSLAIIACRCARKNDVSLLNDAALVLPVGSEFARELSVFVDGGMFSEAGKISNVWARTHDLLPSWINIRESRTDSFRQGVEELAHTAEAGAEKFVIQATAGRDFGDRIVKELPKAFAQAGEAREGGDDDESGSGCLFFALAVIGGTIYYLFFR